MTRTPLRALAAFLLALAPGAAVAAEREILGDTYASLYVYLGDLHAPSAHQLAMSRSDTVTQAAAADEDRQRRSWAEAYSRTSFPDYGIGDAHMTK